MIRTDAECQSAIQRLEQDESVINEQRKRLQALDLTGEEVQRALQPALSFHQQLREEVDVYNRMRRGDIAHVESLAEIGRILIGLRIAAGITQRELAERLSVSESQVSRDERNDYHGITVDRASRIVAALQGRIRVEAELTETDVPELATLG